MSILGTSVLTFATFGSGDHHIGIVAPVMEQPNRFDLWITLVVKTKQMVPMGRGPLRYGTSKFLAQGGGRISRNWSCITVKM